MKRGVVHSQVGLMGFVLAVVSLASTLSAQVDSKQAEEWFMKQWAAAQGVVDLGDYSLHWIEEDWTTPSASEIERMRKEVVGHPHHPERAPLATYERRLAGFPDKSMFAIWARGTGKWRYCKQAIMPDGQLGEFCDFAANGREAWCLLPGIATIVSMKGAPPPGRDFASMESSVQQRQSLLLFSGLGALASLKPSVSSFSLGRDGTSWNARASTQSGVTLMASGSWDELNARGTIDRVEVASKGESVPHKSILGKFSRSIPGTPWMVASEVEVIENQRRSLRLQNVRAEENDPIGFHGALVVPSAGVFNDPIRGETDLRNFTDYRTGTQTVVTTAEDGSVQTATLALRDARRGPWFLRYSGWVIGTLLVVSSVLFFRYKQIVRHRDRR